MPVVHDGVQKLTYQDLLAVPEDGRRHEVMDGTHVALPSPILRHQDASRHIQYTLYRQIELNGLGKVYDAPVDLELDDTNVVVPDLVVQTLSPSTSSRDKGVKRELYGRIGVPEYLVVDAGDCWVDRYALEGAGGRNRSVATAALPESDAVPRYRDPTRHTKGITFASTFVDLQDVWRRLDA